MPLDRALECRGENFPVIGLVYGPYTPDMQIQPYALRIYPPTETQKIFVIEVHPRVGVWTPFVAAVPPEEQEIFLSMATTVPEGLFRWLALLLASLAECLTTINISSVEQTMKQRQHKATSWFLALSR